MVSRINLIFALIASLAIVSCETKVDEISPKIYTYRPIVPVNTREINTTISDFYNWDSLHFNLVRIGYTRFDTKQIMAEFHSDNSPKDTLKLFYERLPYDNLSEYYCLSSSSEARMNKMPGNKYISYGDGNISYKQVGDSADLTFDFEQSTLYRLPDNTKLKGLLRGKFRVPHKIEY